MPKLPACTAVVMLSFGLTALADGDRQPVPDKKAQAGAEKVLRDVYKKEFALRTPADRLAFAKKLVQEAVATKDDPAVRYVMFREAQEAAVQLGDLGLALRAAETMAAHYDQDELAQKASVLGRLARGPLKPADGARAADLGLALVGKSIGADRYDLAAEFAAAAAAAAAKGGDKDLAARCKARGADAAATRRKYEETAKAVARLKDAPDDGEANTAAGTFAAFWKGDWEKGLPLLAKGADEGLQGAAKDDLSAPTAAADRIVVGDRWFDLARKFPGPPAQHLQLRACHWYDLAEPQVDGLTKKRLQKRIDEATRDLPGLTDLRVTVTIDGTDELKVNARQARWVHHDYAGPTRLSVNHVTTWDPNQTAVLANAGETRFLAGGTDFTKARLTHLRGRGGVELTKSADGITLAFRDGAFGADVYEVVVTFR